MKRIMNYAGHVGRYLRGTRAVAAMEYAIIVGVVVVAVGAAMITFQGEIKKLLTGVTADVTTLNTDIDTAQQ